MPRAFITHVVLIALSVLALPVCGDDFRIGMDNDERMYDPILPRTSLEGEMLYMAAEADRDFSMHSVNRKLHAHWLHTYRDGRDSGATAMRKVIRLTVRTLLPGGSPSPQAETYSESTRSQFTRLENYEIDFSDDKIMIGFEYHF